MIHSSKTTDLYKNVCNKKAPHRLTLFRYMEMEKCLLSLDYSTLNVRFQKGLLFYKNIVKIINFTFGILMTLFLIVIVNKILGL